MSGDAIYDISEMIIVKIKDRVKKTLSNKALNLLQRMGKDHPERVALTNLVYTKDIQNDEDHSSWDTSNRRD